MRDGGKIRCVGFQQKPGNGNMRHDQCQLFGIGYVAVDAHIKSELVSYAKILKSSRKTVKDSSWDSW